MVPPLAAVLSSVIAEAIHKLFAEESWIDSAFD